MEGRGGEGKEGEGRVEEEEGEGYGEMVLPSTHPQAHTHMPSHTQTTHTHLSLPTHLGQCLGELLKQVVAVELTVVVDIELRRDIRNAAQLGGRGEESK